MIELDIIDYLNDDGQLDLLLGAVVGDTKIYPIQKPQSGSVPYIVYTIVDEGTTDENLLFMTIEFECVDDNYSDLLELTDRIYELLDLQEYVQDRIISTDYFIYWSKIISSKPETKDTEFNYFHKSLNVKFKYHRKVRWI
jgi:hypothetical protein